MSALANICTHIHPQVSHNLQYSHSHLPPDVTPWDFASTVVDSNWTIVVWCLKNGAWLLLRENVVFYLHLFEYTVA